MTKSRKRMLLSSIAMLLVALVALGSATYAWFSVSKTVTADRMTVKAVAAAGLEISNKGANGPYTTSVSFADATYSLQPISWVASAAKTNTGFIPAENVDSPGGAYTGSTYAQKTAPSSITLGDSTKEGHDTYYAVYKVWVRSASDGSARTPHTDVKATVKAVKDGEKDATTFLRAYLVDETTTANSKVFADGTTAFDSISAADGTKTSTTPVKFANKTQVTATDNTDTGKEYTLVVWYDGEDEQCVDGAKDAITKITVEFTADDM